MSDSEEGSDKRKKQEELKDHIFCQGCSDPTATRKRYQVSMYGVEYTKKIQKTGQTLDSWKYKQPKQFWTQRQQSIHQENSELNFKIRKHGQIFKCYNNQEELSESSRDQNTFRKDPKTKYLLTFLLMLWSLKENRLQTKFLLQIVEKFEKESFQLMLMLFSEDENPLIQKFKSLGWKDRNSMYRFFKSGSLFKGLSQLQRNWFELVQNKMKRTSPKLDKKHRDKMLSVKQLMQTILDNEEWIYEDFAFTYGNYRYEIVDYYKTLDQKQRNKILKFFEGSSEEQALFLMFSDWYRYIVNKFKEIDREHTKKQRQKEEEQRMKKMQVQQRQNEVRLKNTLHLLKPFKSGIYYEAYYEKQVKNRYDIKKLYSEKSALEQEKIQLFFKGALQYSEDMSKMASIWFKMMVEDFESKKKKLEWYHKCYKKVSDCCQKLRISKGSGMKVSIQGEEVQEIYLSKYQEQRKKREEFTREKQKTGNYDHNQENQKEQ